MSSPRLVRYPWWGRMSQMPLDDQIRRNVGFVWADVLSEDTGEVHNVPVGTFFLVTVPSERYPDRRYGYAVTAAHVVMGKDTELKIKSERGDLVEYSEVNWMTPFPERDIAVAEYPGDLLPHDMVAVPMEVLTTASLAWKPRYGATVYYIGLLVPVEQMSKDTVPMVRSASIGALNQPGVVVERQPPQIAHLVDVRSRRGFSGSPCWMEAIVAGPGNIPRIGAEEAPTDLEGFVPLHYTQALFGIFIGFVDEWGTGAVLPVEQLHEVLDHEEVRSMRDENDKRIAKKKERGPFEEMSVSAPPDITEDGFLTDLSKATRRLDDEPDSKPRRTSE